jgi:hypothetical protein
LLEVSKKMRRKGKVKAILLAVTVALVVATCLLSPQSKTSPSEPTLSYPIVSTGQTECFDDEGRVIPPPKPGEPFYGKTLKFPNALQPTVTMETAP